MTTNYHTPLQNGDPANATTFNGPLGELDSALSDIISGATALTTPVIGDFTNAQHTHEDAANGGQIYLESFRVDPIYAGRVLQVNANGRLALGISGVLEITPGMIFAYAGTSVPAGYLLCDGSEVSRNTYNSLFFAIGELWGAGDGATTFNLPDLRERTLIGRADMGGTNANRIADDAETVGDTGGGVLESALKQTTGTGTWIYEDQGTYTYGVDSMNPYAVINYIIRAESVQ